MHDCPPEVHGLLKQFEVLQTFQEQFHEESLCPQAVLTHTSTAGFETVHIPSPKPEQLETISGSVPHRVLQVQPGPGKQISPEEFLHSDTSLMHE